MHTRNIYCPILLFFLLSIIGCSSSPTGTKEDNTPPAVPTNLEIDTIGNGAVRLIWDSVADNDLKGYYVYWKADSGVDTLSSENIFTETNYSTVSELEYDVLYYFGVSSVDMNGNKSMISVQVSGIPGNTTGPKPPSNVDVVAKNIGSPHIDVLWSPNEETDLDRYNIYRALSAEEVETPASFLFSTQADTTTINDYDVEIGVKYYYRITAVDKGGWESASSAMVSDIILPPVTLVSPLNYAQVSKNPVFEWEKIDEAIGYHLFLTTSEFGNEIWNKSVDNVSSQIIYQGPVELIAGEKYYWKIGAISRSEINSISVVESFIVQPE